ncbi:tetratricopeptide repeat protein [Gemmatimonas groenlandica]|uniref:Methyltransferase domain-containing protein n=1 Tax=Gemmatimonas groenlandica TaxID=2732249 RepID=A0A6M4ILH7_9BACT|nr:tetratricopeptide repeat protein [Gemmatimonas groenlandica]QJR34728.1 methyltransferase domain-containing protein [Gemmatimonas groenlandica]
MSTSSMDVLQRALIAHQAGLLAEAEQGYRTVLARDAKHADAAYLLGLAVHQQGRSSDAVPLLRRAVALADHRADFHNSLGDAWRALGQLPEAIASFRAAIARRTPYVDAHLNLATALQQGGRIEEALIMLFEAVAAYPQEGLLRGRLAVLLQGVSLGSGNPLVRSVLLTLCRDESISAQTLSGAMLGIVKGTPAYETITASLRRREDVLSVASQAVEELAHDELLLAALPRLVVTDADMEWLLTRLRKALLMAPANATSGFARFIGALASQAFNTEYCWAVDAEERVALDELRRGVDEAWRAGESRNDCEWAIVRAAMYDTLRQFPAWRTFDDSATGTWSDEMASLVREQVVEYHAERAIADALPALTSISEGVSTLVRAMYEENPYPRWVTLQQPAVTSIPAFVRALRPTESAVPKTPRILVAGGGSGQQPVQMALAFPDAVVSSIDLSRSSLAYAARMAARHGVTNVQWAHGDILAVDESIGSFAIVSCSGVLHHLAEPLDGWRRLIRVLEPHGVMKIGLYSRAARRQIDAARELVQQGGFAATDEGIRASRQAILALPSVHPARGVLAFIDFFSMSGCRDLLMHVQERSYTVSDIARDLDTLELRFLGFQVSSAVQARFRAEHPAQWLELSAWEAFEAAHPDTFAAMYQFWCCPR